MIRPEPYSAVPFKTPPKEAFPLARNPVRLTGKRQVIDLSQSIGRNGRQDGKG